MNIETKMNPFTRKLNPAELVLELKRHAFLDPLWDANFKMLVADQHHPERLVHFLNALLRLQGLERIASATLQGSEQEVVLGFEKKIRFDIHCKSQRGEPIIVDMQRNGNHMFKDRMLYYSAIAINRLLKKSLLRYF